MATQEEIAAIKLLVGQVDISAAQTNPNIFNDAVEAAIGKILAHYDLSMHPVMLHWERNGTMRMNVSLVPNKQPNLEQKAA